MDIAMSDAEQDRQLAEVLAANRAACAASSGGAWPTTPRRKISYRTSSTNWSKPTA